MRDVGDVIYRGILRRGGGKRVWMSQDLKMGAF